MGSINLLLLEIIQFASKMATKSISYGNITFASKSWDFGHNYGAIEITWREPHALHLSKYFLHTYKL